MYVNQYPDIYRLPDRSATVWRYMDLFKFLSMLEKQALFFCSADLLGDRFEGSYPRAAAIETALPHMVLDIANDPTMSQRVQKAELMIKRMKQQRDYDVEEFPSWNLHHPYISKRKSFEYERELRAVIWDKDRFAGMWGTDPVDRRDNGTLVKTDLNRLIQGIRVSPDSPIEFRELITSLSGKYAFTKEIEQSKLDNPALY